MKIYNRELLSSIVDNLYNVNPNTSPDTYVQYREESIINNHNILPVAFYLPQYYPIEINNIHWGEGFTEWSNVTRAVPQFVGHYQPHQPEKFGYYDTRIPNLLLEQALLAHKYGLKAFCFYYYYFQGKTELEYPLKIYANSTDAILPFCLCWANENWTRKWDGRENEILLQQKYDIHYLKDFITKISTYFSLPHYFKIKGRPLVLIYNPSAIPNLDVFITLWREHCYKNNIFNPYIIGAKTFDAEYDILNYGLDALMEFPPHGIKTSKINIGDKLLNPNFKGTIYSIKDHIEFIKQGIPFKIYRGVFPSWDNTSRVLERAKIFIDTEPDVFENWCDLVIDYTISEFDASSRLLFVNAWNEWGEGAHLEPDKKYGYAYLQVLRNCLNKK